MDKAFPDLAKVVARRTTVRASTCQTAKIAKDMSVQVLSRHPSVRKHTTGAGVAPGKALVTNGSGNLTRSLAAGNLNQLPDVPGLSATILQTNRAVFDGAFDVKESRQAARSDIHETQGSRACRRPDHTGA